MNCPYKENTMPSIGFTADEMMTKQLVENACRVAAMTTKLEKVEDYVKRYAWFHSMGCMLDPTGYRDYVATENGKAYEEIAKAFLEFRRVLEKYNKPLSEIDD